MASLGAIDWVLLAEHAAEVGDVVCADAGGGMPIYRVVAVEDDQAWLQDGQHPAAQMMPLARFHWKAAANRL